MTAQLALDGLEAGKRTVRTELAIKYQKGSYLAPAGGYEPCTRTQADWAMTHPEFKCTLGCTIVTRQVVTYTTDWVTE